jgi:hypothetical protein
MGLAAVPYEKLKPLHSRLLITDSGPVPGVGD